MAKHSSSDNMNYNGESQAYRNIKEILESNPTDITIDIQARNWKSGSYKKNIKEYYRPEAPEPVPKPANSATCNVEQEGTKIFFNPSRLARNSSFVTLLNTTQGRINIPERFVPLVKRCKKVYDLCNKLSMEECKRKECPEDKHNLQKKNLHHCQNTTNFLNYKFSHTSKQRHPLKNLSKQYRELHNQLREVTLMSNSRPIQAVGKSKVLREPINNLDKKYCQRLEESPKSKQTFDGKIVVIKIPESNIKQFCPLHSQTHGVSQKTNRSSKQGYDGRAEDPKLLENNMKNQFSPLHSQTHGLSQNLSSSSKQAYDYRSEILRELENKECCPLCRKIRGMHQKSNAINDNVEIREKLDNQYSALQSQLAGEISICNGNSKRILNSDVQESDTFKKNFKEQMSTPLHNQLERCLNENTYKVFEATDFIETSVFVKKKDSTQHFSEQCNREQNQNDPKVIKTKISKIDTEMQELWDSENDVNTTTVYNSMQNTNENTEDTSSPATDAKLQVTMSTLELQLHKLRGQIIKIKYELSPRERESSIQLHQLESHCTRMRIAADETLKAISNNKLNIADTSTKQNTKILMQAVESLREYVWLFQSFLQDSHMDNRCNNDSETKNLEPQELIENNAEGINENDLDEYSSADNTSENSSNDTNSDDAADNKVETKVSAITIQSGKDSECAANDMDLVVVKPEPARTDCDTQTQFSCVFPNFNKEPDTKKIDCSSDSNFNTKMPTTSSKAAITEPKEINTSLQTTQTISFHLESDSVAKNEEISTAEVEQALYNSLRETTYLIPGEQEQRVQIIKTKYVAETGNKELMKRSRLANAVFFIKVHSSCNCNNLQFVPVLGRNVISEIAKSIEDNKLINVFLIVNGGTADLVHISVGSVENDCVDCFYCTSQAMYQAYEQGMCDSYVVYFRKASLKSFTKQIRWKLQTNLKKLMQ